MSNTTTAKDLEQLEYQDDVPVTVLHGWGRVDNRDRHFIDKTLFEGGVARDVPCGIAKHWVKNTRPDGNIEQLYGRVKVHILPADATEADFVKATGIQPVPVQDFANMIAGVDLDALVTQMGAEKVNELIGDLRKRVPQTSSSPYRL